MSDQPFNHFDINASLPFDITQEIDQAGLSDDDVDIRRWGKLGCHHQKILPYAV